MARKLKISDGDLFAKGKTKVACVSDVWHGEVDYVIIKGPGKGDACRVPKDEFLNLYPTRVDKIVIS